MSYTNMLCHIVIRTKYSRPTITATYERDLYAYIYAYTKAMGCWVHRIGGMPDHVHILIDIPTTVTLSDLMRGMKTTTSKRLKEWRDRFPAFEGWEKEYYACSVSPRYVEAVKQYIMNQKEHRQKKDSRTELIELCQENGIDIDERYIL